MSLAPCIGVLLCAALTAPATTQSPGSSRSSAVEAHYSAPSHGTEMPLSASVVTGTGGSSVVGDADQGAGHGSPLAVLGSPEPGMLLVAGSLLVWIALARRRNVGASR